MCADGLLPSARGAQVKIERIVPGGGADEISRVVFDTAREGGNPFAAREQVRWTRHPGVKQAVNETLELLRKAGVVINDVILSKLGVSE